METELTSTSVQNILVMLDVLVVNGMIQSLIFSMKEPDYNIIMISTFSGFTVPEGQKEERRMTNGNLV